jgi:hypothetical protein
MVPPDDEPHRLPETPPLPGTLTAGVLRRREPTRFWSARDDEVGGFWARSAASGSEQFDCGSCAGVLRRREPTRFWSARDDEVGGFWARSAASGSEQFDRASVRGTRMQTARLEIQGEISAGR